MNDNTNFPKPKFIEWTEKFKGMSYDAFSERCYELPKETLEKWEEDNKRCKQEWEENYFKLNPGFEMLKEAFLSSLKSIGYSERTPQYIAVKEIRFAKREYPYIMSQIYRGIEAHKEKLAAEERNNAKKQQRTNAIKFLLDNGVQFEDDLVHNAVKTANEVRFIVLVHEARKVNAPWTHSLCSNCSSWKPQNKFCDCGKVEISWNFNGNFENMKIFPTHVTYSLYSLIKVLDSLPIKEK